MKPGQLLVGVVVPSMLVCQMLVEFLTEAEKHEAVVLSPDMGDVSPQRRPDVLLVAAELLADAVGQWPGVPVLALADRSRPEDSARALCDGASGVIDNTASLHDLADAVGVVASGQTWLPPTQVSRVLACLAESGHAAERAAVRSLTRREQQVMLLLGQGFTRREIADRLFVSAHTARTHVQNVLEKLDVHSQVAVVAIARRAMQSGLLEPEATDGSVGASAALV